MMLSYDDRSSIHNAVPGSRGTSMKGMSKVNNVGTWPKNSQGHHRHIWIITGPAGCGKTTVAKYIAENLNLPYIEGDEYHPPSNIKKMAEGRPLTDEDRWDWLVLLRKKAVERLTSTNAPGVVLTCSALKHKYRDVIRIAAYNDHDVIVHFVFLHADEQTLIQRVRARKGHYMKDSMVHSQFVTLEEPEEDEKDCLSVDVSGSVTQVQRQALGMVQDTLTEDL
jgi:gluconokinase